MKTKYEKLQELRAFWYRDIRDFEYWQNLHKNLF